MIITYNKKQLTYTLNVLMKPHQNVLHRFTQSKFISTSDDIVTVCYSLNALEYYQKLVNQYQSDQI